MIYLNDNDRFCIEWLRGLRRSKLIEADFIDERDIKEIDYEDIHWFTGCHFFAGIGGWPYALQLADWPADRSVWTGSCPCQPFSSAGKRKGTKDERHLWPVWQSLIAKCKPSTIFGEQVASPLGREWLEGVSLDLEELGYAVGAADLCAASIGAPHIRQRLFWVANCDGTRLERHRTKCQLQETSSKIETGRNSGVDGLADSFVSTKKRSITQSDKRSISRINEEDISGPGWSNFDLLPCEDGKQRRVESGVFPLAHGVSGRMAKLRGLGNAIVPQVAATFIRAFMETEKGVE